MVLQCQAPTLTWARTWWEEYRSMVNQDGHLGRSLGDTVISNVYRRLGHDKFEALSMAELLNEVSQLVVKSRNKLV